MNGAGQPTAPTFNPLTIRQQTEIMKANRIEIFIPVSAIVDRSIVRTGWNAAKAIGGKYRGSAWHPIWKVWIVTVEIA